MRAGSRLKEPRFLLMYAPQRFDPRFGAVKPEGSLGIAYLAGALRDHGYEVKLLDCCVGNEKYGLQETFHRQKVLSNGMIRVGLSPEEIVQEVADYDVVGLSSIFTAQTAMVEETVRAIAAAHPDKLILLGGVNARAQAKRFLDAGASLICLSEAEKTILDIGQRLREGSRDFSGIEGIALKVEGQVRSTPMTFVEQDLDKLPIPAWDLMPLAKYWEIARPHGGGFSPDNPIAYASAMTSRGCPFNCHYCHISREFEGSDAGSMGKLRLKSMKRVLHEMDVLKGLGVKYVFLEDDSLLAKKNRVLQIFKEMMKLNLRLSDVNGINLSHLTTTKDGKMGVDEELLETMAAAGFEKLIFPVESGSQRILTKYATNKLVLDKHNVPALIRKAKSLGLEVGGNYTYGYPDETHEEMLATFNCAKEHMDAGMDYANFHFITPFPGTQLYENAVTNDWLIPGIDLAELDWTKPSMKTIVPAWILEFIMTEGWEYVNKPERIKRIRSMGASVPKALAI